MSATRLNRVQLLRRSCQLPRTAGSQMRLFGSINVIRVAVSEVVVHATEGRRPKMSSSPLSGLIFCLGSRNIQRLGCTRSGLRLPLPQARHPRSWEFIGAMRTTSDSLLRNESNPRGLAKVDAVDGIEPSSLSFGSSVYGGQQFDSISGTESETRPHSVAGYVDMNGHSDRNGRDTKVDIVNIKDEFASISPSPDLRVKSSNRLARNFSEGSHEEKRPLHMSGHSDLNGRHVTVDIVNIKDELASISPSPVLRVKSSNRLVRNFSEGSHEEKRPLVRAQPKAPRAPTEAAGFVPPEQNNSFRGDVGHAAGETVLLTRLAFNLLRYLGVGYRWITKFLALGLYAVFLMPGFLQVGYQYFFNKNVRRSIVYGPQPRNRLDLYMPEDTSSPKPVVIFVTGGAWIIGYKAWGSLLGLQLSERDVMICCVDYRNFPQGRISDMVEDISTGIGFIINNIAQFGGDPDRIYLAGQSAGSHIAACALIEQARIEIGQQEGMTWKTRQLKAFMGLSGGYNLPKLVDHFHERGLYKSIFLSVMEGETSLPLYSPELTVQSEAFSSGVSLLPPIYLFHGTADYSIPSTASENFAAALRLVGAQAFLKLYPEKTHTDVFLQDPMRGGKDLLWDDLLELLYADDEEAKKFHLNAPLRRRLVPEFLLHWAHVVSPF